MPAEQRRALSDEARWLADALGAAASSDIVDPVALEALTAAVEERRLAAYTKATRAVRSRRYTGLLLRLLRWFETCAWRRAAAADALDQPIDWLAAAVLGRRRRAVKRRSKGLARQSAQQRHRLRIALKKLRYASEVLANLYSPAAVESFTERLKRLQDDLGDANDVRVGRDIVADLAKRSEHGTAVAEAGNAVLDWHERRLARRERKLKKHLDRLLDAERFWAAE